MAREYIDSFKMTFPALSRNESFARASVAAFVSQLDPTLEEICDIKAAVSEAVTNCIVHAYGDEPGVIELIAKLYDNGIYIKVKDKGCGINDIPLAMTPLYTSSPEGERAGLGFAVMESFMTKLRVQSKVGQGTSVIMQRDLEKRKLV